MKIVKSNISVSLASRFVRHVYPVLGFLSLGGIIIDLSELLSLNSILIATSVYLLFSFIVISYTNPIFIFTKDAVSIKYPNLFKWKNKELKYSDIEEILFRGEIELNGWFLKKRYRLPLYLLYWSSLGLILPYEYKWLKIMLVNSKVTVYCFGLEYDYYDNSDDFLFEDLKAEFSKNQIKTRWTDSTDPYFSNDQT